MRPAGKTQAGEHLGRARDLAPLISEAAADIERLRDLPEPLFAALIERGLFRLLLPAEYGGAELPPTAFVPILEEIARHDASTAWCVGQNNVCTTVAAFLAPDAVADIFAGPRAVIAWGPPAGGTAKVVPGGFLVAGTFHFASGSRHATWLGANVAVLEPDGKPRLWQDGSRAVYTLLFPKERAKVLDTWQVIGLKGTGSDSYTVADLFVPDRFAVPRGAHIRPRVAGKLYVFSASTLYASGFAGIALGIARATLDAFIADAKDTLPRGAKFARGENHAVQSQVGQAEAKLRSARMFLLGSLAEIWDAVAPGDRLSREQQVAIRLAGTWAIQQSREVVTTLYLAAGAMAIFEKNPFERRFRDVHTVTQQIQGHASQFETVGQVLMGQETDRPMFTF